MNPSLQFWVTAGAVALIASFLPIIHNRSKAERDASALSKCNAVVTFWKTWLEANASADLPPEKATATKQRAAQELANLSEAMDELVNGSADPQPPLPWPRRLLVLYWPAYHSFFVWFSRFCFYFSLWNVLVGFLSIAVKQPLDFNSEVFFFPRTHIPKIRFFLVYAVMFLAGTRFMVGAAESEATESAERIRRHRGVAVENLVFFFRGGRKS